MLCFSDIGALLLLRTDGAQRDEPRVPGGWLTATLLLSQHHITTTAHFHGLAEKQPSKQENHIGSQVF